ncbi:response regulator [Chryseobacterium hagamense]|uniref:DNA-binding response regulator n=1 Tax=Chryseobacterium hagamense TaxID=395935 RepID=A0A511YN25_9FLAO|nr:response regulator transcription factor [Chryseobacterium hagamense]GEN76598.1 DNA-binding response regulator [Chryseobacterium hagamense]
MNRTDHKGIRFLLADDHSLIRQGLVFVLEDLEFEHEVFHASNLQKTMELINTQAIDIAIIDAHFPDGNSLSIIPEIKKLQPRIRILIFTGIDEEVHALKFINAGVNGFLSKLNEEDEIKEAIRKIIAHGEYISSKTQVLLLNSIKNPNLVNPFLSLTEREFQIAGMYREGLGNLEIANRLDIKQNTVSTLKRRIFDKLKIDNLVELIELYKNHY